MSAPAGSALLAAFLLLSSWLFFRAFFLAGQASLSPFFSLMPWVLLVFVPAAALRTGTALGKFLVDLAILAVAIGLTFPVPLAVSALGDPDPGPLIGGYLGLVLLGAVYVAISRFASSLTENRIAAFIVGVTISFALFIVGENVVLLAVPARLEAPLRYLGLGRHFANMARGIVDSRDLVYFVSVTGFFLCVTRKAAAALALLVVVSVVSLSFFARADLTARREFTISRSSRDLLAALPDVVTVTVYLSEDLPRHLTGFRTRIEDVLDQYRRYGGKHVRVSFVDPSKDPEAEARARSAGIEPVELHAIEGSRAVVRAVYLGMTVQHAEREEAVPSLADAGRFEYDLTSAILKVLMERRPVVGFLTGHGERSILGEYSLAAESLRETYDVREVSTGDLTPGGGITTLVAAGSGHMPDAELYEIDQFLMRGGRAVFLLDGTRVATGGELLSEPGRGNIYDFVGSYGAVVGSDLVVDMVNSSAGFTAEEVQMTVPYPYWPKAIGPNISREHPVVSGFDAIPFPWTSSIAVEDRPPGNTTVAVLARSSDRSWSVPAFADLRPLAEITPPPDAAPDIAAGRGGHLPLAVAVSGGLTSAFVGKPVIRERDGQVEFTEPEGRITTGVPTQIVVIGNARMFENALLGQFGSNLALFRNIVDWLTLGDTLADIQAKPVDDRPLRAVGGAEGAAVMALGIFAAPAGVAVLGIARAAAMRRRRSPATRASGR